MPHSPIAAVMIHVGDIPAGLAWYQSVFPEAKRKRLPEFDFEILEIGSVNIEIVQADEKVASGAAGSVVYWSVDDLSVALDRVLSLGGVLYRGPIRIENGLSICQFRDPWGNCIGLRG